MYGGGKGAEEESQIEKRATVVVETPTSGQSLQMLSPNSCASATSLQGGKGLALTVTEFPCEVVLN